MIHKSIHQFLPNLFRLAVSRVAAPAFAGRLALGAIALALAFSAVRLEGATSFNRGPSERELHFLLPGSSIGGLLIFEGNQGDFLRQNADGTYWLHGFSTDATLYLGLPLADVWHTPEEMIVFFVGIGRFTWFDVVTRDEETDSIQTTSIRSNINAKFALTSTAAAQELLGIPEGTPFQFRARIVERNGEAKVFEVIFEPIE